MIMPELRTCPLCLKPAALQSCCPLGKVPPFEWSMEQMLMFLDVLKGSQHRWHKFGSLGDMVDAPLNQGGYKEIFKRERLTGKLVIGKQRKTISDTMKRFGVGNVRHRDLICESLFDLSKPAPKIAEEIMMEELSILVKNSWTEEFRPDIQLQAMTDILRISADPLKHEILHGLGLAETLMDIVTGPMMDPAKEMILEEQQKEIDDLKARRKKNELDYHQKKELDRKEHQQATDWIQRKADFGSLAIVSFCIFQNFSTGSCFMPSLASERFCTILVTQLALFRAAEKNLHFLKLVGRGQYLNLVSTEVEEQQLVVLSIILNLSSEVANRIVLVQHGISKAVVDLAFVGSFKDSAIQLKCLQILSILASTAGQTEELIIQDGVLNVLVPVLRNGFGEVLLFALATLSHLAFVPTNNKAIINAGSLAPLTTILKRGDKMQRQKAIDVIRNLSAASVDDKLIGTVVPELIRIICDEHAEAEHKLRCLIALRSLARFEQALNTFYAMGVVEHALSLMQGTDHRMRLQALGLLVNTLGNTATAPLEAEEEDDVSNDDDDDTVSSTSSLSRGPTRRGFKVMQERNSAFLRLLSVSELQRLATDCPYLQVPVGSALVKEGEVIESAYVLISGVLKVLISTAAPRVLKETSDSHFQEGAVVIETTANDSLKLPNGTGEHYQAKNNLKASKGFTEILRLRSGETACELCLLDGKPSAATIVAMKNCVVLKITVETLVQLLSKRPELLDVISPGERAILPIRDQLKKLWSHSSISDEVAEKINLSRMELGHVRTKLQKKFLQSGAQNCELSATTSGRMLLKVGMVLLIGGPDTKDDAMMEVDEEIVLAIREAVDSSHRGKHWHGHQYQLSTLLLASRLMVLNDKNKRQFIRCSMIPWILRLVKGASADDIIRLATSILLSLSFAMRARWLLRPIMLIWLRFVKQEIRTRAKNAKAPPLSRTVDIVAPLHIEDSSSSFGAPVFEIELHEAASEGGVLWMQRLVEDEISPDIKDTAGASAMHFAALGGKMDAIEFLLDRGVSINVEDAAGCTPLAWLIMARQIEFGVDRGMWPEKWQRLLAWLDLKGAEAKFVPVFPFSV